MTDEYLAVLRAAWGAAPIPIWIGGNSAAALRRAAAPGDAWHPLRLPLAQMRAALAEHALPGFAPRIALQVTDTPVHDPERMAGVGTVEQILGDLDQLRRMGAGTVVLDPYRGDPDETRRPDVAWQALTDVTTHWRAKS